MWCGVVWCGVFTISPLAALIKVVANLDPANIKALRHSYSKDIGRDLIQDIKSETSGDFEDALVGKSPPRFCFFFASFSLS